MFKVQKLGPKHDRYLYRVHLTPWSWWPKGWRRIYLHVILRPDQDDPHCHPFDFTSLVIWGGYEEQIWSRPETIFRYDYRHETHLAHPYMVRNVRHFGSLASVKAEHTHRISHILGKRCITLVFRGPKRRDWSFHVPAVREPRAVPWRDYLGLPADAV